MFRSLWLATLPVLCAAAAAMAGPYSMHDMTDPADPYPVSNQFDYPLQDTDARILAWADAVVKYSPAPGVGSIFSTVTDPVNAIGSLGDLYDPNSPPPVGQIPEYTLIENPFSGNASDTDDEYGFIGYDAPGSITVSFARGIFNGTGADFAVFENGADFGTGLAADLAYVEVSSYGEEFARFDSIASNTSYLPGSDQYGTAYASIDPSNVYNLAGKHLKGWGTPFDLEELTDHPLVLSGKLDLQKVRFVRLVDVPGIGHTVSATGAGDVDYLDSQGNNVLDAWATVGSGGFDFHLDKGVGALNAIPEPGSAVLLLTAVVALTFCVLRRPHAV